VAVHQVELDGGVDEPGLIDAAFADAVSDLEPPADSRSGVVERASAGGVIDREVRARTDAM